MHSSTPYQVGGSLRLNSPTYVTRPADSQLYRALKNGQFCYVLNCRQMGKSSLRVQTMQRLKTDGIRCIALDMTRIGSEHLTPQQWYERLISELWRGANLPGQVNLKTWWEDHQHQALIQLLDCFIEEILLVQIRDRAIVIFIDEIDSTLSLDFPINDFFALIRACYNQRVDNPEYERLTFCLLGVATPSDLMSDKTRTPFNIGQAIALHGFEFEEAKILARGLEGKIQHPLETLQEILNWTGGQPFLTQKACQWVVEEAAENQVQIVNVESLIRRRIIEHWETQDEPAHLRTIRDRLLRDEKLASRLLGLYQDILKWGKIPADESEGQMELRLSGLAVKQNGSLTVYNRIYAEVFHAEWVAKTLDSLRPYAEAFQAWVVSEFADESRLLRGQALEEALQWSEGRSLSDRDTRFLRESQQVENRETKQAVEILNQANRKAGRRLRIGGVVLGMALLAAGGIAVWAGNAINRATTITRLERQSLGALEQFRYDEHNALLSAMRATHQLKQFSERKCLANWKQQTDEFQGSAGLCLTLSGNRQRKFLTSSPIVTLQTILDSIRRQVNIGTVQLTSEGGRIVNIQAHPPTVLDLQGNLLAQLNLPLEQLDTRETSSLSSDGKLIAIGGHATVVLWNLKGEQVATFETQKGPLVDLQLSPDRQTIALLEGISTDPNWKTNLSVSWSGEVGRLLDLQGRQIATIPEVTSYYGFYNWVRFSPDGQYFLTSGANEGGAPDWTTRLWNRQGQQLSVFPVETIAQFIPNSKDTLLLREGKTIIARSPQGQQIAAFQGPSGMLQQMQVSPNGNSVATVGENGRVILWNWQGKQIAAFQGQARVLDIAFSPNSEYLATAGGEDFTTAENTIKVWNVRGARLATSRIGNIKALQFTSDSQKIVSDPQNNPAIWHWRGHQLATFRGLEKQAMNFRLSPDGKHLVVLDENNRFLIWDLEGKLKAKFQTHPSPTSTLLFTPKSDRILTNVYCQGQLGLHCKYFQSIQVSDFQGKQHAEMPGEWKTNWKNPIDPDGKYTVTVSGDNRLQIWDMAGKKIAVTPQIPGAIQAVQFSPDSNLIATAGGYGMVRLWNLKGEEVASFQAHPNWVEQIYFTAEGDRLMTVTPNHTSLKDGGVVPEQMGGLAPMKLWDLQGNLIKTLPESLAGTEFRPNNNLFVRRTDDGLSLWNAKGEELVTLPGRHEWFDYQSDAIQISNEGGRIATIGKDGKVRVWDFQGNQIAEYDGYTMALSSDGQQIVVVSLNDNIPKLWHVDDLDELLKRGCNWLRPSLAVFGDADDKRMCGVE